MAVATAMQVLMVVAAEQVGAPAARVALLAVATGLVAREVLAALSTDKRYTAAHCVGRRALTLQHPI